VCALIVVEFGGGSRGRRDVGRVRRISILARSSVCSDIWSISIWCTWRVYGSHLLPSHPRRPTPNDPPRLPVPPPRNGHARCRRLCKRSLSTLWVEVYRWVEGKRNCPINVFLTDFRPRFCRQFRYDSDVTYEIFFETERRKDDL